MGLICKIRGHEMATVAISTAYKWHFVKDPKTEFEHIIAFQVCKRCGHRGISYEDPTAEGFDYAKNGHSIIAKHRAIWFAGGDIIPHKDPHKITWIDPRYAPAMGMEEIVKQMYRDPELGKVIEDNPSLKEAVDNLEFIAKMCKGNK